MRIKIEVDNLQLMLGEEDLSVEVEDGGAAATDGVGAAEVGLVDDGGDEVLAVVRREGGEEVEDEAGGEESVDVAELPHLGGGEVGRQRAGGGAPPLVEFAGGA